MVKKSKYNFKNTREKIYLSPYIIWRLHEYEKSFIDPLTFNNPLITKILKNKKPIDWMYSSINRYFAKKSLGYNLTLDTVNTITAVFKIKDITKNDREVIYNIAYIGIKSKKKNLLHTELLEKEFKNIIDISENLVFQSICPSGSLISKDGEYRSGLINWNILQIIFKNDKDVNNIFKHIYNYINNKLKERKYILLIEYFFPTDKLKNMHVFETELMCSKRKIEFLCIAWFNFYFSYNFGFINNHINETYKKLLLIGCKEDIKFFQSLFTLFEIKTIEKLRYIFSENINITKISDRIYTKSKLGQKIIPLNILEAQNPFNIEYKPWKELMIMLKTSDLVVNNLTNGFALCNSWLLIKNPTKGLFDNPSQSERIEKSIVAKRITEILQQAKILTKQHINKEMIQEDSDIINLIENREDITTWLSTEFNILKNKIKDSIFHSKENIIMSNVSLAIISEYLGKTIYDAIFFTKKSEYYKKNVGHILAKETHAFFRKYIFQLCYNLYLLNSKLGVMHGDLHLNNITLNSIIYSKKLEITVDEPKIMYRIDKDFQYIFEHNFYDLCLIDFSRSIINIDTYKLLENNLISKLYPITNMKKIFQKKQITNLLNYLITSKIEFKETEVQLFNLIKYRFSSFFKILTVLDLYNISNKFIDFMKHCKAKNYKPYDKNLELMFNLNKSSEYYINIVLTKLIEKKNYKEVDNMEWPILTIIKDNFSENHSEKFTEKDFNKIVDIYNCENKLEHTIFEFAKFPTDLKYKKKVVNGKVLSPNKNEIKKRNFIIKKRKLFEQQYIKNFQTINIIIKRHLEKHI